MRKGNEQLRRHQLKTEVDKSLEGFGRSYPKELQSKSSEHSIKIIINPQLVRVRVQNYVP